MHILMTADTIGGVWTYTKELAAGLTARGHRITLVSFGRHPTITQCEWLRHAHNVDFHPTEFRLEWMQDSACDLKRSETFLENLISALQPDVLHFNQYCYGRIQSTIPRVVVAHSDVLSWWSAVHGESAPGSEWLDWYRATVTTGLIGADCVVAPSRWMLEALEQNYPVSGRRQVIYNGRSSDLFDPDRPKRDCVLTIGRLWDEGKQASLLLHKRHPVPVYVVGQRECGNHKFENAPNTDVTVFDQRSEAELRELYAESSTYAATSRYEPFGLAPVEAAMSRCTLVANDIGPFRELWEDAAIFFERNDPESLAETITCIASSSKLRAEYADRAYECANAKFKAESMIDQYEQLYRELTGRRAEA